VIVAKELNGKIYLAQMSPSVDTHNVGGMTAWFFIGPGEKPFLTWVGGEEYVLNFQYLSHNFTRVLDASVWPPNQVDPATYNPISIQRPEEWFPVDLSSQAAGSEVAPSGDLAALIQSDPYVYWDMDTDIYHTFISRDTGVVVGDGIVKGYRVYERPVGTPTWTLLQDWTLEVIDLRVESVGGFDKEFGISWGALWDSGSQNHPDPYTPAWHEYPVGSVLTIAVVSRVIVRGQEEIVPCETQQEASAVVCGDMQRFFALSFWEDSPAPQSVECAQSAMTALPAFHSFPLLETTPADLISECASVSLF